MADAQKCGWRGADDICQIDGLPCDPANCDRWEPEAI